MIDKILGLFGPSKIWEEPRMPPSQREGKIDTYSDTWIFIQNWLEADLARSREKNDAERDEIQTAMLRGRIKLLKEMIELPLPPKRERQRTPRPMREDEGY